jgi:hypothetical protein
MKLTRNYFGEGDYLLLIVFKLKDANERETAGTYHVTTGIICCVRFLHLASHAVQCVCVCYLIYRYTGTVCSRLSPLGRILIRTLLPN